MFLDLGRLSVVLIHSDVAEEASSWTFGAWDNSLILL